MGKPRLLRNLVSPCRRAGAALMLVVLVLLKGEVECGRRAERKLDFQMENPITGSRRSLKDQSSESTGAKCEEDGARRNAGKELLSAAKNGNFDTVQRLLDRRACTEEVDGAGRTPLFLASVHGHVGIVDALLFAGANVNAKDNSQSTPLHESAASGEVEIVEILMLEGGDINAKNNVGWSPLHWAAYGDHSEIVILLLVEGASSSGVSSRGFKQYPKGSAPLHVAAGQGSFDAALILLDDGADVNSEDSLGRTPKDVSSDDELISILG